MCKPSYKDLRFKILGAVYIVVVLSVDKTMLYCLVTGIKNF